MCHSRKIKKKKMRERANKPSKFARKPVPKPPAAFDEEKEKEGAEKAECVPSKACCFKAAMQSEVKAREK
jgi:hypothetical protein